MTGFVERSWIGDGNIKLYARDYGAASSKLPVVCIPGLTRNSRDFEDVAPWMAEQGRRVLAVDLRGRGRSARDPNPANYQPRVYADDVAGLMRAIGVPRAVFLGTSLGGLVTMQIAVRHPSLIGAAVLNDISPVIAKDGVARIAGYVGKGSPVRTWADAEAYVRRTNGIAYPDYTDQQWRPFARRLFTENEGGVPVLDYDPGIFKPAHPIAMRLTQSLVWQSFKKLANAGPVMLMRGALTDIVALETVDQMQHMAPHMFMAQISSVGHAPMLDEPDSRVALHAFMSLAH